MSRDLQIQVFRNDVWAAKCAQIIDDAVDSVLAVKDNVSVMLTGGRGAERVYREWANTLHSIKGKLTFYFGDERCVEPTDPESNFAMVNTALFNSDIPNNCTVVRLHGEATDQSSEAQRYEELLPLGLDILLLSIGEDGHVASLFPYADSLNESRHKVVAIVGPKAPKNRYTITPTVIRSSDQLFCFVSGESKVTALKKVLENPDDFLSIPARLAIRGMWLLDESAGKLLDKQLKNSNTL